MKKVIQLALQVQFVQVEDNDPVVTVVASNGQVIDVVSSLDDIPSVYNSVLAELVKRSDNAN